MDGNAYWIAALVIVILVGAIGFMLPPISPVSLTAKDLLPRFGGALFALRATRLCIVLYSKIAGRAQACGDMRIGCLRRD